MLAVASDFCCTFAVMVRACAPSGLKRRIVGQRIGIRFNHHRCRRFRLDHAHARMMTRKKTKSPGKRVERYG
jgi:hypothetical protein